MAVNQDKQAIKDALTITVTRPDGSTQKSAISTNPAKTQDKG